MDTYYLNEGILKITILIILFIIFSVAFIYFLVYKLSGSKVKKVIKSNLLDEEYLPLLALGSTQLYKEQHNSLTLTIDIEKTNFILINTYEIYNASDLFNFITAQLDDQYLFNLKNMLYDENIDDIPIKKVKAYLYSYYDLSYEQLNELAIIAYSIEHCAVALRLAYNADYISEESCILHLEKLKSLANEHYDNNIKYLQGYILGVGATQKSFEPFKLNVEQYIEYLLAQLWHD